MTSRGFKFVFILLGFVGHDASIKSLIHGAIEYISDENLLEELTKYYETQYSILSDTAENEEKLYWEIMTYMKVNYRIWQNDEN